MGNCTVLYEQHQKSGAKLIDFAGWDMPLHYGSQIEEHNFVRNDAGMFDVSHMLAIDLQGSGTQDFLRYLLANDVAKLQPGRALYTCMLNEQGGILDDLIVYYLAPNYYRIVVNAGTREKDLAWMQKQSQGFMVTIKERTDLAIVAIQGPHARAKADWAFNASQKKLVAALKPFQCVEVEDWLIARTGYTGEDGYEVMLPAKQVIYFWRALLKAGVKPCGLGARDTLRLEAGLNLYGTDMNEKTTPLEVNLAWTVAFEPQQRKFIGRVALEQLTQTGVTHRLVGLIMTERGVIRNHQKVIVEGIGEGEVTSGSFSPTLGYAIGLARVPMQAEKYAHVVIRDKAMPVNIVKPPFVRNGQKVFEQFI